MQNVRARTREVRVPVAETMDSRAKPTHGFAARGNGRLESDESLAKRIH